MKHLENGKTENKLAKSLRNKRRMELANRIMTVAMLALVMVIGVAHPALAATNASVKAAISSIIVILKVLTSAVGAILILVGIVKYAMAYMNEDGPGMQKAIMFLATGIVLLMLGLVVLTTDFGSKVAGWISNEKLGD